MKAWGAPGTQSAMLVCHTYGRRGHLIYMTCEAAGICCQQR